MSDELQVQTPTGLQVQGSPTFQQTGPVVETLKSDT